MKFKKGDHVICEVKKFKFVFGNSNQLTYDIEIKKGIICGTTVEGYSGIMYLVKCNNGEFQNYFYEDNITLDIIKIREDKLNELGI